MNNLRSIPKQSTKKCQKKHPPCNFWPLLPVLRKKKKRKNHFPLVNLIFRSCRIFLFLYIGYSKQLLIIYMHVLIKKINYMHVLTKMLCAQNTIFTVISDWYITYIGAMMHLHSYIISTFTFVLSLFLFFFLIYLNLSNWLILGELHSVCKIERN